MSVRRFSVALVFGFWLAASIPESAVAQEEDPAPIVYASYFECEAAGQSAGDIIRDSWAPIAQSRVDSGALTAWGSLVHNTGGEWSRVLYHVATDRAGLFATIDEMVAEWLANESEAAAAFWDECDEHEDYVWEYVTGSDPAIELAQERPSAGMSVYYVCDQGRGALADLLVEEVFAPLWNEQVESGLINSWSWMSHLLGGQYRRILVADGATHDALLTARGNVIQAVNESSGSLAAEFSDVCNGHTDYLWNIEMAGP